MENLIINMPIELLIAILIPLVPTGVMAIRYFWKKEKCFTLMKQKIDELSKSESGSNDTHNDLYDEINNQGNRITSLEAKMNMLLDHFNIKHTQ